MNPYFALSAVFSLGMRGIEKKLKLPGPPIGELTVEDKKSGKVRRLRNGCSERMRCELMGFVEFF